MQRQLQRGLLQFEGCRHSRLALMMQSFALQFCNFAPFLWYESDGDEALWGRVCDQMSVPPCTMGFPAGILNGGGGSVMQISDASLHQDIFAEYFFALWSPGVSMPVWMHGFRVSIVLIDRWMVAFAAECMVGSIGALSLRRNDCLSGHCLYLC